MWAHSEKSFVAESMGTGVVPWLWLWDLAMGSLWDGWIRISRREAECCRKSPEVHLLKGHPAPPARDQTLNHLQTQIVVELRIFQVFWDSTV